MNHDGTYDPCPECGSRQLVCCGAQRSAAARQHAAGSWEEIDEALDHAERALQEMPVVGNPTGACADSVFESLITAMRGMRGRIAAFSPPATASGAGDPKLPYTVSWNASGCRKVWASEQLYESNIVRGSESYERLEDAMSRTAQLMRSTDSHEHRVVSIEVNGPIGVDPGFVCGRAENGTWKLWTPLDPTGRMT